MLTPRKWGVELECYGPADRSQLQAQLRARHTQATATGYGHEYFAGWRLTTDGSIGGFISGYGHEIVSPPSFDSEELERVCQTLQELRFSTNSTCGMHTHVDAEDLDLHTLKQLVKLWMRYEPVFASLVAKSRLANQYCRLLRHSMGFRSILPFAEVDQAHCGECLAALIQGRIRYSALNLEAWWRHGTVEFRLHHGTVDGNISSTWVELMAALVELATTQIEVPAVTGTVQGLLADMQQHLAPQARVVGLAHKLKASGAPPLARRALANADQLKPLSAKDMAAWALAPQPDQQLILPAPMPSTQELVTACTKGAFPSPAALARLTPTVALPAEAASWA